MNTTLHHQARTLAERGDWREVCALLDSHDLALQPELSVLLGEGLLRTGDALRAKDILARVVAEHPALSGDAIMRRGTNLCGAAHFELGELGEAEVAFARAGGLARDDGDDLLAAQTTNNLALIASIRGQYESALALYRVALPAYQRLGNTVGLAQSLHNMAITCRERAALEAADEYEQRAMEYARAAGDDRLVAIAMVGRVEVQMLRGDATLAEATAVRAAECFARIPDPARQADALRLAGVARANLEDPNTALRYVQQALDLARDCGAALIEAECLRARAGVLRHLGDTDRAKADDETADTILARMR